MNRLEETELIREICARLDASVANLQPELANRLHRARRLALEQQGVAANPEAALLLGTHQLFDSSQELSPAIETRLDAARRRAIARYQTRNPPARNRAGAGWLDSFAVLIDPARLARPASMLATTCVLVTIVSLFYVASRPESILPIEEEMSLIASADDFELYENLEFYMWLVDNGLPN